MLIYVVIKSNGELIVVIKQQKQNQELRTECSFLIVPHEISCILLFRTVALKLENS